MKVDRIPAARRPGRTWRLAAVAFGASVAMVVTACGGSSPSNSSGSASAGTSSAPSSAGSVAPTPSGTTPPGTTTTVTFETDYLPNGEYAFLTYGQDQGYFKDEGIDLKIAYGRGSGLTAQAVAGGKVDMGLVDSGVLALSVSKGQPIISVGQILGTNSFAYWVPQSSPVKKIADLKGHSLVVAPGTPQAIVTPAVLSLVGLDQTSVDFKTISPALAGSSYAQGTGDAIGESVNFAPVFQNTRPSRPLPWAEIGYRMPGYAIAISKQTLDSSPELIARVLKAIFQSLAAALDNPEAAIATYVKAQPTISKDQIAEEFNALIPYQCSDSGVASSAPLGYQVPADWSAGMSLLKKTGVLPDSVETTSLYTNEMFDKYHVSQQKCVSKWSK